MRPDTALPARLATLALPVVLSAVALPSVGLGAEVTDLPPQFRGDVHVRYDGAFDQVGIEEDGVTYGLRNHLTHDVTIKLEAAVYQGVALYIALPIEASWRIWYPTGTDGVPAARQMLYEPVSGQGTYVKGQPLEVAPDLSGSGLQGVWIGVAGAPFREDYHRGVPITSRFDVAVRTPARNQTMYGQGRGAAPGGVGLLVAGAFSADRGIAEPYLRLAYQGELASDVEVTYADGSSGGTLRLRPASTVSATVGAELVAMDNPTTGSRFAFDLSLGMTYRSWSDVASGFWLPSVLPTSMGIPVTQGETVMVHGGAAIDVDITRYVGLRLGATGTYFTPYRIEHVYPMRTDGQSFAMSWTAGLVGRIRTKSDRK